MSFCVLPGQILLVLNMQEHRRHETRCLIMRNHLCKAHQTEIKLMFQVFFFLLFLFSQTLCTSVLIVIIGMVMVPPCERPAFRCLIIDAT